MLKLTFNRQKREESSDSDEEREKRIPVPKSFKIAECRKNCSDSKVVDAPFILDTNGTEEGQEIVEIPVEKSSTVNNVPIDKELQKILAKAKCGPQFEKNPGSTAEVLGRRALKRVRQAEASKTTGRKWFDMPATELTDEARADLEVMQMRDVLDPTAHYRKNDRTVLPKYFQIGHVVDAPEDYYSSRIPKKLRKKTIVDELLADSALQQKNKAKFNALKAKEAKKVRGAFQHSGHRRSKKKDSKRSKKKH